MIEVVEHPTRPDAICVRVTPPHELAKAILNGELLLTKYVRSGSDGYWVVPVVEFPILIAKLDEANLRSGREMTEGAWSRVQNVVADLSWRERVKQGHENSVVEKWIHEVMKTTPYPDQVTSVAFALSGERRALLLDMGLGKSLISLTAFAIRKRMGLVDRCLVVCPNNVKATWIAEIAKHTHLKALNAGNGTKQILLNINEFKNSPALDILVIHYEAIRFPPSKQLGKISSPIDGLPIAELITIPFDQIIVDEFHLLKNISVQRAMGLFFLIKNIKPTPRKLVWTLIQTEEGTMRWVQLNQETTNISIGAEIEVPL